MNWMEYVDRVTCYCTLQGWEVSQTSIGIPLEDLYKMYGDNLCVYIRKHRNIVRIDYERGNGYEIYYDYITKKYENADEAYVYFLGL